MPSVKYLNLVTILHTQPRPHYMTQSTYTLFDSLHYFDLAVLLYGGQLGSHVFFKRSSLVNCGPLNVWKYRLNGSYLPIKG